MISKCDRKMNLIHTCVNFIQFLIPHEEVNAKTALLCCKPFYTDSRCFVQCSAELHSCDKREENKRQRQKHCFLLTLFRRMDGEVGTRRRDRFDDKENWWGCSSSWLCSAAPALHRPIPYYRCAFVSSYLSKYLSIFPFFHFIFIQIALFNNSFKIIIIRLIYICLYNIKIV